MTMKQFSMFPRRSHLALLFLASGGLVPACAWSWTSSHTSAATNAASTTRNANDSLAPRRQDRAPLFYRNRPLHEEQHGPSTSVVTAAATASSSSRTTKPSLFPTMRGSSLTATTTKSDKHDMNTALMLDLVMGQVLLVSAVVLLATTLFGTQPSMSLFYQPVVGDLPVVGDFWATSAAVVATVSLLIVMERTTMTVSSLVASCNVEFATNNLVVALWGRRSENIKQTNVSHHQDGTTDTWTALVPTLGLAFVTALCQETIFRSVVPSLLWQGSHSIVVALLGAIILDGLYHSSSTTTTIENQEENDNDENNILWTQTCLQAIVYTALVAASGGNLGPAIAARTLYTTHAWTTVWHGLNDQIDWATQQQQNKDNHRAVSSLSEHDAQVWEALQQHAQGALTVDHAQLLQRFFYAFDTDHEGTLSLDNVQKAVAYSFWNNNQNKSVGTTTTRPTPAHVQALFKALVDARPTGTTTTPSDRLTWVEFVRLLVSLRAAARTSL